MVFEGSHVITSQISGYADRALSKRSASGGDAQNLQIYRLSEQVGIEAVAVFVDHTDCYWLKWLRRRFRHCFVAFRKGSIWVVCDSLKNHMELILIDLPTDFDLPAFYADQGHVVLAGTKSGQITNKRLSGELLTCVTVAKRLLGIRSSSIWTPWQLFRFLTDQSSPNKPWHLVSPSNKEKANFQLDI